MLACSTLHLAQALCHKVSLMPHSQATTLPNCEPDLSGHIAQLWIYPVKSCAGIRVPQARLTATGLEHDRAWMVVDLDGEFLSQRELPHMVLITPKLMEQSNAHMTENTQLELTHPSLPSLQVRSPASVLLTKVRVWDDIVWAHDQGDEAAEWLSQALGQSVRLVRQSPKAQRQVKDRWSATANVGAAFADAYPLLVTTLQTQHTLQAALQDTSLTTSLQRFRANIVLDGLEAHEEDHVSRLEFDGPISIQLAKPCVRCAIPNIDPQTATVESRISQALSTYRQDARMDGAITFGMNAYIRTGLALCIREGQDFGAYLA